MNSPAAKDLVARAQAFLRQNNLRDAAQWTGRANREFPDYAPGWAHMALIDLTGDTATIDGIINMHTQDAPAATSEGSEDSSAIFILGLPCTGTTLTERIVGSHSEVKSAGELRDFATELVRLCDGQQAKQDMVALTLKVDMQKLGENYVKAVRQTVSDAPHVIDHSKCDADSFASASRLNRKMEELCAAAGTPSSPS